MAMPVMHLSPKRVSYAALPSVADILSQEIKHAAKSWNAYCSIFALKGQPPEGKNSAVRFDERSPRGCTVTF
jgi:hypothetical protein